MHVRAASRNPGAANNGVEPVRFDWADRRTSTPALRGVDGLYVVGPYAEPDASVLLRELLAIASDVQRVALLSILGADQLTALVPMAAWEQDARHSGKQWTILRPNWFHQNFAEAFAASLRDRGALVLPAADAAVSFIDTRDVADVAATALTEDGHDGQVYDLTGPQSLTHAQAVAIIGKAAGRELRYADLTPDQFAVGLHEAGVGEAAAAWQLELFQLIRNGVDAPVTDTVEKVTGHPARPLAAYAAEHATAWQVTTA